MIEPGEVWNWADEIEAMIGRRPAVLEPLPLDGRIFMAAWWLELMESIA
jgi:hypothetical protein